MCLWYEKSKLLMWEQSGVEVFTPRSDLSCSKVAGVYLVEAQQKEVKVTRRGTANGITVTLYASLWEEKELKDGREVGERVREVKERKRERGGRR